MPAGLASHPDGINLFYLVQVVVGSLLVVALIYRKRPTSGFKLREADRLKDHVFSRFPGPVDADAVKAHARAQAQGARKKRGPALQLPGISIDGPAHRILGVRENATASEVNKAWRELMKRYHPDKVGRPGSREWADAQRIAEAINQAKEQMAERRKKA
jgi:hypothetical protein